MGAVRVSTSPADLLPEVRGRDSLPGPQGSAWKAEDLESGTESPQGPPPSAGGLKLRRPGRAGFPQIKAGSPAFDSQTSTLFGG